MNRELHSLRDSFGRLLVILLWGHVPLLLAVAWLNGRDFVFAGAAGVLLAGIFHVSFHLRGASLPTRYLSAVVLMAEPALLVFLMRGHPWQMDMHMYFFATLALMIAWFDRRPILLAAGTVALHHLVLLYLLPWAVFPTDGTLARVLLHAAIVAFQTAVLVWLADMIREAFTRIRNMNEELVANNATLEQRTEEAERANSSKSLFLANMSHEIRTPLNAVLGFCHLLQRTPMTPRQEDYVAKIGSAGSSLLRLLNDILDLSKHEAGKLALEFSPFNPHAVIEQQLQMVLEPAKAKGVHLDVQKDPILPARLMGDELRFGQVILNLVNNAVKFTERGSVTVRTRMQSRSEADVVLAVEVIDTGIGMSAEQQSRLFASFSQADNSMTRRYGGTGLGLAISRQIVGLMGGEISVQSQPWVGTVFSFTVRLGLVTEAAEARPVLHSALRDLRILAVDDNPASRQLVEEIFEQWSIPIETVGGGAQAIERLEGASAGGRPFDCVLIDWKMPDLDGLETARAITANGGITPRPKMVLVTAYGSDRFTAEVEGAGISAYLPKPLEIRALISTLEELFAHHLPSGQKVNDGGTEIAPPMVAAGLRGARVLLVEDNPINAEIASELLSDAGLLVDLAENGQQAVDMVAARGDSYGLVLMDLQMPVMDGLEATQIIRQRRAAAQLPIIAMTAHAYADERERCFEAGMNDHVAKPVDPLVLVATLERWLKPAAGVTDDKVLSPPPPVAAAAAVTGGDLPEDLPPFGIARALERVNGKKALLRRLIVNFATSQADAPAQIRRHMAAGETEDARRVAHTLKGLAGSLEVPGLQEVAADLERQIKDGRQEGLEEQIALLAEQLAPAIAAGSTLMDAVPEVSSMPVPITVPDGVDPGPLRAKLAEQLARRSLGARAGFAELAAALGLEPVAAAEHPLSKALERLDYATALAELERLPGAGAAGNED